MNINVTLKQCQYSLIWICINWFVQLKSIRILLIVVLKSTLLYKYKFVQLNDKPIIVMQFNIKHNVV